jgi:sulfur carrier protein
MGQSTGQTADQTTDVRVNGERHATRAATLAELVAELGYGDAKVATACNGAFVAERARAAMRLQSGDEIEIVAPRQGG